MRPPSHRPVARSRTTFDGRRAQIEILAGPAEATTDDALRTFVEGWIPQYLPGSWTIDSIAPAGELRWLAELSEVPRGNGA